VANILAVDDEKDIQGLAETTLKEAGHNVTTAQDGEMSPPRLALHENWGLTPIRSSGC